MADTETPRGTILVVDDEPTNLQVLFDYLGGLDYRLLLAEDGEDALDQAAFAEPDLILLDVMMPGIDGFETCRRLKKDEAVRGIPVIMMTALADTRDKVEGFRAGAVDYITKPFQQEEVLARIDAHITLHRQRRELQEALAQVKRLSGMLPICAECKKIRNDHGYWQGIETYIREHSEATFSHGICPACAKTLYPDLFDKIQDQLTEMDRPVEKGAGMPFAEVDGEAVFYTHSKGSGRGNLVLIHGSGGDHTAWPEALLHLAGPDVYAPDLPGHGKSRGSARDSVEAYAAVIQGFVERLDLTEVVLAGHSLGGAIAQTLALRNPPWLDRIILVGTGARLRVAARLLDGLLVEPEQALDLLSRWSFGPEPPEAAVRAVDRVLRRTDPRVTHSDLYSCDRFDAMDRLGRIAVPTLVISATEDRLTPVKYGEYLKTHIPGARIAIIEGAGHMMGLERPAEFVDHISEFLDNHGTP